MECRSTTPTNHDLDLASDLVEDNELIRIAIVAAVLSFVASPSRAEDLAKALAGPPVQTWQTSNSKELKFCVITGVAAKTGQASTVVDRDQDTYVIVHNWSSPVPGNDVRGVFIIKPTGVIEFRGQKVELIKAVEMCSTL